jgi:hypothetical protein
MKRAEEMEDKLLTEITRRRMLNTGPHPTLFDVAVIKKAVTAPRKKERPARLSYPCVA